MDTPDNMSVLAARNNAEWCHSVAKSHGIQGRFLPSMWASSVRTPLYYPDAVMLDSQVAAEQVVAAVDATPGCSVKDSFACLDLTAEGFSVLFDAEWICLKSGVTSDPLTTASVQWARVLIPAQLDEWQTAWSSDDDPNTYVPALLAEDGVVILAGRSNGSVVAGAILNRSTTVIGISNVFGGDEYAGSVWIDLVKQANDLFPGCCLVGYESGDALASAKAAGFRSVGPLRVWLR